MARLSSLMRSSRWLSIISASVLAAAIAAGALVGVGARGPLAPQGPAAQTESYDFVQDVRVILVGNARVVATLLLGACTGGLMTVAVLVWNGFHLGFGVSMLWRSGFEHMHLLMRYLPFEFAGLGLVAAASLHLSAGVWALLVGREPVRFRGAALLLGLALLLLVVAACIEAAVKPEIGRR